ncbi:MAG: glutamate--tRNA ligase [Planctomycetota bacterium]|jgi:glutamyl-tRNA synthetase|nr:glutamate--tRNA ligase [Planctomycetota bacterium]
MTKPRVRFAPSPTGNVHIGNIRAAIFNWLFARHNGGQFLLRVEDTDLERSTPEAIKTLLEAMDWLGLTYDEEPMYQSKQIDRHLAVVERMIADGCASRRDGGPVMLHLDGPLLDPAFVTEPREEVEVDVSKGELRVTPRGIDYVTTGSDGREHHNPISRDAMPGIVVDFDDGAFVEGLDLPPGKKPVSLRFRRRYVFYDDLVLGRLEKPLDSIRDLVIVRSDGSPIFHLANVVDDIDQGVTHILRGNDHVENTYRHLFIFKALGATPPRYGHFPMIVNARGKPYSKRDGDAYVGDFRDKGCLPECLFNFLALCGWGREDGVEIMSRAEMVEHFDLSRVSASAAQLNLEKLNWMNGQYLMRMPATGLIPLVREELSREGVAAEAIDPAWLERLIGLEQERLKTIRDFVGNTRFFFLDFVQLDPKAVDKVLRKKDGAGLAVLRGLRAALGALDSWDAGAIEKTALDYGGANGVKAGDLAQPLRVAVTGGTVSRGIWETLELLGRDKTLARIDAAIAAA